MSSLGVPKRASWRWVALDGPIGFAYYCANSWGQAAVSEPSRAHASAAKPTLLKIARRAGVSTATVSRALRNLGDISPETTARIRAIAQEVGYLPRTPRPRSRARQRETIGVVVADNSNPLFSKVVKGVEEVLSQRGMNLVLMNTGEDYHRELHCVETLLGIGVGGILLTPSQSRKSDIEQLARRGVPFVLVGRHFPGMGVSSVVADDCAGAHAAVAHLIRLGHRQIVFLNGPGYISSAVERLDGYRKAFEESGLPVDARLMRECPPRLESAYNAMKSILVEGVAFTAVFTFNDVMMLGVIQALREVGRRIPADTSLVGFDDVEFASFLEPPLTTVHMPKATLGRESARLLLAQMYRSRGVQQLVLPTELIVRGSTMRCAMPDELSRLEGEQQNHG